MLSLYILKITAKGEGGKYPNIQNHYYPNLPSVSVIVLHFSVLYVLYICVIYFYFVDNYQQLVCYSSYIAIHKYVYIER